MQLCVFYVEYTFIFLTSNLYNSEQETAPNLYPVQMKNRDFEVYMLKEHIDFYSELLDLGSVNIHKSSSGETLGGMRLFILLSEALEKPIESFFSPLRLFYCLPNFISLAIHFTERTRNVISFFVEHVSGGGRWPAHTFL